MPVASDLKSNAQRAKRKLPAGAADALKEDVR